MGERAKEELFGSVSRLYNDAEYSDLTIHSGAKSYLVHKAIVCPRCEYFAKECRNEASEAHTNGILSLFDDPLAVEMVIKFLYHLDYDAASAEEALADRTPRANGQVNGDGYDDLPVVDPAEEEPYLNHDGRASAPPTEDSPSEAPTTSTHDNATATPATTVTTATTPTASSTTAAPPMERSASRGDLDEFLPIQAERKNKKKRRQRKKSVVGPLPLDALSRATQSPEPEPEVPDAPEPEPEQPETAPDAMPDPPPPTDDVTPTEDAAAPAIDAPAAVAAAAAASAAAPPPPPTTQGSLTLHAKVYALAQKYGIGSLQGLARAKFAAEAREDWDTDDFLLAAREVYTAAAELPTAAGDGRGLRDVVTAVVYEHAELLDDARTQEVIRGLDLSYDVLMHVRRHGGFKTAGVVGLAL